MLARNCNPKSGSWLPAWEGWGAGLLILEASPQVRAELAAEGRDQRFFFAKTYFEIQRPRSWWVLHTTCEASSELDVLLEPEALLWKQSRAR